MVDSGLRVWEKQMGSNHPAWIPGIIYACSGIIPASQQVSAILSIKINFSVECGIPVLDINPFTPVRATEAYRFYSV